MLVVGLTGGIGSGKTTASDWFKSQGIDIVDADVVAREVVEPGTEALQKIAEHFGANILEKNGQLNRAALRQRVFSNAEEKRWLESLLHPLIGAETLRQLGNCRSPYCLFVSPLLIEAGQNIFCHRVLLIDAPEAAQATRTAERDNNDPEQVRRIMASQASREQRLAKADDVVSNAGTVDMLYAQLAPLHERYLQLAKTETR